MRVLSLALLGLTAVLLPGCSDSGPKVYRVQGTATFNGQPIVFGDVLFTPDDAQQNFGPQGIATIQDGRFDTANASGLGVAGGPTVVRVTGLDKPGGNVLCEYEYKVDLPRSDTTHNVEVPASGAWKVKKKGPEI